MEHMEWWSQGRPHPGKLPTWKNVLKKSLISEGILNNKKPM